jgi:hypothetical protein
MRNSKMAFQVSPGVQVKEVDLTNVVPAVSTSIGAYAGSFVWGPVDKVVQVGSEKDLVAKFGRPDDITAKSFLTASQFLAYGSDLRVVRADATGLLNATSASDSVSTISVDTPGAGYTSVPTVTIGASDSGNSANDAEATAKLKVLTASAAGGGTGTGYSVDDVLTINLGAGTEAQITVTAVDVSGAVSTVSVQSGGSYTSVGSQSAVATSGGTGTGAQINITSLGIESITVTAGGDGYDSAPSVTLTVSGSSEAATATATLAQAGVKVKNEDHKDSISLASAGAWVARYPGELGNSLKVVVADHQSFEDASFTAFAGEFDTAPDNGEVHVVVVDEDGSWTGSADSVLETYAYLGKNSGDKKSDGTNNYYVEVINRSSEYVWAANPLSTFGSTASSISLAGGSNAEALEGQRVAALTSAFEDSESIDVNLIIGGDLSTAQANLVIALAEKRKDCVAFVSPPITATVGTNDPKGEVLKWANGDGAAGITSSSYAVMDSTAGYMYDKYNDVYRWVSASGAVAGLCANTDSVADSWFSPAGPNRGQIRTFAKLAFNPKQAERDSLYKARVNPIVSFPGEGTLLFGDKTALAKPSAFDRINVRRLFITIEKAIATASKFSLFEFNDEFTRAQFLNLVEPFLRDVQGRRGITDFRVVCDETNNTGEVIDTNRFVSDIYIKPARSINFITLSFVAARTGVDFSEIVGG